MITGKQINQLSIFAFYVSKDDFIKGFGVNLGEHLWDKYRNLYNYDMLKLWGVLDSDNKDKLVVMVNQMKGDFNPYKWEEVKK